MRTPVVAVGLFLAAICGAYLAAEAILADDLASLGLVAVLLIAATVVVVVLKDWRKGLYLLIAWMLLEDFFRKHLGNNMAIYLVKDILSLILYLSFYRTRRSRQEAAFRIPFRLPLLLFIWFALLQVFNPASSSVFYGLLGMKVDFIYIPLIYVGYALIQSEEDLHRFFSFMCVLMLSVAGLGLAQSIIGPSFLNPQTPQEEIRGLSNLNREAPISGLVAYRPASIFVSHGRFADFLIVSWIVSLGYGGYLLLRRRRGRTLAFTTIGVIGAASLMSTSRGVFMWNIGSGLVITAGFLWGAPWRQREALRVFRTLQRIMLVTGLGIIVLLTIFPKEVGSRLAVYSETLLPGSPTSELVNRTQTYPLQQLGYAFEYPRWPYGYGLGTCTLGMQYVIRILHAQPMGVGVESGYGQLILELGIVGLVLWVVLSLSLAISAWKAVILLRGSPWFPLSFSIFLFAFLILFPMMFTGISTYQDFILNSYLWLFLGMLYRLRMFQEAAEGAQNQAMARQA